MNYMKKKLAQSLQELINQVNQTCSFQEQDVLSLALIFLLAKVTNFQFKK